MQARDAKPFDSDGEEQPRAYIVKAQGKDIQSNDVIKFMESKVSRHKRLTGGVQFVDVIEKNPVSLSPLFFNLTRI